MMKDYTAEKIRNIALVGHGSSGKTSLAAAILFNAGVTSRLTKVDKGNTVTDFEPEEIERKITIGSAMCFVEYKDHKINIVDTPGYSNFLWDTRAGLRAVDAAAVLVDGVAGIEVGTEKVWEMLEEFGLPRIYRRQQARPRECEFQPDDRIGPAIFRPAGRAGPDPHRRGEEFPGRHRPHPAESRSFRNG